MDAFVLWAANLRPWHTVIPYSISGFINAMRNK